MKTYIILILLFIISINNNAQSIKKWNQDLDYLIEKYQQLYPNLHEQVDSAAFHQLINEVRKGFDEKDQDHNIISLFKVHAFLKDAHSVPMVFHPAYNLHGFPIRLHKFKEGWFIIDAKDPYSNLIGSKIIHVHNTPIADIFEKSSEIISSENEYGKIDRFEMFGLIAEWLKDDNVIQATDSAEFELKTQNGDELKVYIKSTNYLDIFNWVNINPIKNNSRFAFFNPRNQNYWLKYDKDKKTLYFQFNSVNNQDGEPTIAEFTKDLAKTIKRKSIDKFIIDLRNNNGGDDSNLPPLLALIRDNKSINQYGKLFVITGRHNFSSGVLFAWQLRLQTEAIFIGEPSAQGPVFNANADFVFLPNSKIGFTVSKTSTARNQPNWCFTPPKIINVDYPVQYSINDFNANHDPAVELISSYNSIPTCDVCDAGISGRYKLSDFHIMNIEKKTDGYSLTITDFMDNSLFRVRKHLCYNDKTQLFSDKNGVFTLQKTKTNGEIIVSYDEIKILAKSFNENEFLPVEAMKKKEYSKALDLFRKYAETYKKDYIKFEYYLTMAGYNLLSAGKIDLSLQFFELLVEIFPDSWNAYDSYGEALAKAGKIQEAILQYQKSIELNPDNQNGKDWLKKLNMK